MGCSSSQCASNKQSKPHVRKDENELVRYFTMLCNSTDNWNRVASTKDGDVTTISTLHGSNSDGYFTYRGKTFANATAHDLLYYYENTLGGDRFELLEEIDDHQSIYHWLHEVQTQRPLGSANAKRNTRGGSFSASSSQSITVSTLATTPVHEEEVSFLSDANNADASSSASIIVNGKSNSNSIGGANDQNIVVHVREGSSIAAEDNRLPSGGYYTSARRESSTTSPKAGIVARRSVFGSRKASTDMPVGAINHRDFVICRSSFRLSSSSYALIFESAEHKLKRKIGDHTTRGKINIMGVLIEEIDTEEKKIIYNYYAHEENVQKDPDGYINAKRKVKEPLSKITFVISINPCFTGDEFTRISEQELSQFFGEARIRDIVDGARLYFELPENKLFVQFRALASAPIGDMGWMEQEKTKSDLQLGTNVKHPAHGHGIVKKFDMKGRIHVAYDNGEVIEHEPSEKDSLHVAVQIGTRVVHPKRGAGTVKQFDETGRIHVKFDNGEYHRYKQAAWKKKMHEYKLLGTGGALETIRLSYRDFEHSREKQGKVKFAVGASTTEVLEYLLSYEEDAKTGNIIKNEIVEEISPYHRIRYQQRKMPSPLTDRDFVYDEIWREVAPLTYIIINKSVEHESKRTVSAGVVRGMIIQSGYLIEPLFTEDGKDHIAQITHVLCIDPQGFVPPNAVAGIRSGQLLGAVTDMRAHFWKKSKQKKSIAVINRKRVSKRVSEGSFKKNQKKSLSSSFKIKTPVA